MTPRDSQRNALRAEYHQARADSSAAIARVVHNTPLELRRVRESMDARSLATLVAGVLCVGPRAVEVSAMLRTALGVPTWGVLSTDELRAVWPERRPSVVVIDTAADNAREALIALPMIVRVILWGDLPLVRMHAINVPRSTAPVTIAARCRDALEDVAAAQRP